MTTSDKILKLTRQLYPSGRAFKMPTGGESEKLHKAIASSLGTTHDDARSILNSILPDNDEFSEADATDWERRLGLITNEAVPLADRKLAIQRKMQYPGTIPARQNFRYLEGQLQAAGFDVYVHENRFDDGMGGYETKTLEEVVGGGGIAAQYGDFQYGDSQYGGLSPNTVVNHIDEAADAFVIANLRFTFFIGGAVLGAFANVSTARKAEFRQMIIRIKPVQTAGYLLVNYI